MAGHSKFKNIQHRKGAQDKKRAKIFTKLVREIITAAKTGAPDLASNPRLRNAIISARSHNLPKDKIEKAIAQANSDHAADNYTEVRYEGFASHGIAIIVEALTDNKNRTAGEVRAAFTKFGGNLGEIGSVSFMFDHLGIIQYDATSIAAEVIFDDAIIAGASDIISNTNYHNIYTKIDVFSDCLDILSAKYGAPQESYIEWKPCNVILIEDHEQATQLLKLIDLLEESDDVQMVFTNHDFSDSVCKALDL